LSRGFGRAFLWAWPVGGPHRTTWPMDAVSRSW